LRELGKEFREKRKSRSGAYAEDDISSPSSQQTPRYKEEARKKSTGHWTQTDLGKKESKPFHGKGR